MILRALEVAAAAAAWLQRALRPTESHTSSPASPPFTCGSGTGSVGTAGGMVSEGADHAAGRCGGKAGGKAGGRGIPEGGGWESCESSADKKTGSRGAFDGFGVAEGFAAEAFAAEAEEPRRLFRGSCSGGALACEYYSRSKSSIVVVVVVVV